MKAIIPGIRLLCTFAVVLTAVPVAHAQDVQTLIRQRTGKNVSTAEILRRLRESGYSRAQVSALLRQAGYDPSLADVYFDELARSDGARPAQGVAGITRPLPEPDGSLVNALGSIGVLAETDSLDQPAVPARAPRVQRDTLRPSLPQVFGKELFAETTEFQTLTSGPVDSDYRLGPGDQLTLIVTGDVELAYSLEVTREGHIIIPDIGQIFVAGVTVDGLRRRLSDRLAQVYSGIQTGSTRFDLSMGRLRRNLVHIIGEVEVPGAYQVSGGASVFNALYQAGGPNTNGSFRTIQVRRQNQVVQEVDLYDYLLRGDKRSDLRLDQADIIFVPVVLRRVTVTGSVRRPAIYELKPNESLIDVIGFAGGVQADASLERIQIDRILPPEQRRPGVERTIVDVSLAQLHPAGNIALNDGDLISVFAITGERRNRVTITGDVHRPGLHEFRAGMTVRDLVQNAQGLLPTAYTASAHIVRLNPADSTTSLVRIALADTTAANYAGRVELQDLDELVVFGRARLSNPDSVRITGFVKQEGAYPFSAGVSVQDLILLAGGFREGALASEAEVARRNSSMRGDSLAQIYHVPLSLPGSPSSSARGRAEEFTLQPGDRVFIRRRPGYLPLQTVTVAGEVVYPGVYTVESNAEPVSRIMRRAGGLTPQAYARGFQLLRDGKMVNVDLHAALANPSGPDDLMVRPNDQLTVPVFDPTVLVTGAVAFESRIRYEPGLSVKDYLNRAGGAQPEADNDRISVRYANGELRTARSVLTMTRYPRVEPGSVITVPEEKPGGMNWDMFFTRTLTIASAMATVVLAINSVK